MDKDYWEDYYKKGVAPAEESPFSRYVARNYIQEESSVIELGCGNGRDAAFLAACGAKVLAIDQALAEIEKLQQESKQSNLCYEVGNFTKLDKVSPGVDVIYSRFTLHSITAEEQVRTLAWAASSLAKGGILAIEVRGKRNGLYRKGTSVPGDDDAYIYEDHYRRFIDREQLEADTQSLGLTTIYSSEQQGFAPFNGEDDFFIRHIAERN